MSSGARNHFLRLGEPDLSGSGVLGGLADKLGWQTAARCFLLLALCAVALLVRLPSFDGRSLWADELWRANLILGRDYWHAYFIAPNDESAITAPIYALLVRLCAAFTISPLSLRLSSLLPGILSPALGFLIIRKARPNNGLGLPTLCGLAIALNRSFISYSTELKPYAFEICVHLICIYVWLTVISNPRFSFKSLALCFGTLALALLSTANTVFLLPSFAISLGVALAVRRDKKTMIAFGAGLFILAIFVGCLYFFCWRSGDEDGMMVYWAPGFRSAGGPYLPFLGSAILEMWRTAFSILEALHTGLLSLVSAGCFLVLIAAGRRFSNPVLQGIFVFYGAFAITVVALNLGGFWPLGAFRPNLFVYAHMIMFTFLLACFAPQMGACADVVLLGLILFWVWHAKSASVRHSLLAELRRIGPPIEHNRQVVEDFSRNGRIGREIAANCARPTTVIIGDDVPAAITYFTSFDSAHISSAQFLKGPCIRWVQYAGDQNAAEGIFSKALRGAPVWVIYSHETRQEEGGLEALASKYGRVGRRTSYGGDGYFQLDGVGR